MKGRVIGVTPKKTGYERLTLLPAVFQSANECGLHKKNSSKLPFPVIKLLNISNFPEFIFKQFAVHSYGRWIVAVGATTQNDLTRSC